MKTLTLIISLMLSLGFVSACQKKSSKKKSCKGASCTDGDKGSVGDPPSAEATLTGMQPTLTLSASDNLTNLAFILPAAPVSATQTWDATEKALILSDIKMKVRLTFDRAGKTCQIDWREVSATPQSQQPNCSTKGL
jgi:hypothetical protein